MSENGAPVGFVQPVLDAIEEQPAETQRAIWAAVGRGELTWHVLDDGRVEFRAGGHAFVRLACIAVLPVAADNGQTH